MSPAVVAIRSREEREKLFRFRYRIYVEEKGLRPAEADHTRRQLHDWLDEYSASYALFDGTEVTGSLRVTFLIDVPDPAPLVARYEMAPALAAFGPDAVCTTSRFMLDRRFARGKGMRNLVQAAYRDALARGVRLNYGDCGPELVAFYEHLGYRTYGGPFTDPSYGPKVRLLMLLRDGERLRHVRSPLAQPSAEFPQDVLARTWFERTYGDAAPDARAP
jgi:GNAT superfamily N-acetyltransferase